MFNQFKEDQFDTHKILDSQIADINKKIERIEERFMNEEISKDFYIKYTSELKEK